MSRNGTSSNGSSPDRPSRHAAQPKMGAWAELDALGDEAAGEYDALAELFLGETGGPAGDGAAAELTPAVATAAPIASASPGGAGQRMSAASASIVGVLVGNVPVMASAWVRQYARHLAEHRGGPVALVQVRGEGVDVELVGASVGPAASVEEAIRLAAAHARAWMIRVDGGREHELARSLEGSGATLSLLSSADEAASVGAYRSLKSLLSPAGGVWRGTGVELVIVGAPPERAAAAVDRLSRAAASFLGRPLTLGASLPQIAGTPERASSVVFQGPTPGVEAVTRLVVETARLGTPTPTPMPAARTPSRFETRAEAARPTPVERAMEGRRVEAAVDVKPMHAPAGGRSEAGTGLLAGLADLGVVCPVAPKTRLGVDQRGTVHIVVDVPAGGEVFEAMGRGALASGWVMANAALLGALAAARGSAAPTGTPIVHLVAEDARTLRAVPDATARLHVAVRDAAGAVIRTIELN